MPKVYRSVLEVCWGLGLICTLGSIVFRLLPTVQMKLGFSPRGLLMLAAVLFLCVLATAEVGKTPPSS